MKRNAFSLIELIVVIGVIIILLALTLPLMWKLQENGRVTQCTNNLRQISVGLAAYVINNEGRFPNLEPWEGGPDSIVSWAGKTGASGNFAEMSIGRRPLNPYLGYKPGDKELPMCSCPGDDFRNSALGTISTRLLSCYNLAGTSYYQNQNKSPSAANRRLTLPGGQNYGIALSQVKRPDRIVAMGESSAFYPGQFQEGSYDRQPDDTFDSKWHRDGRFTLLFVDGHVARHFVLPEDNGHNDIENWSFYLYE